MATGPEMGRTPAPSRAATVYTTRRAIVAGGSGLALSLLPMFLVGALAVPITEELGFGSLLLGVVVAMHRLASAPAAVFAGRLADRLGAGRSLQLAAMAIATACLGIVLTARGWVSLALWLALSGAAMSLADPAANRLLVNVVPADRLGSAFGFKQSAPPSATMLAGLSVPLLAVATGWRSAFLVCAVACIGVLVAVGRVPSHRASTRADGPRQGLGEPLTIVVLSTGLGLCTAASSTIPAFFVVAAVDAGSDAGLAGGVLAGASIATIIVRMLAGLAADRMATGHLRLSAAGQLAGALGLCAMATATPVMMLVGVVLALAGTWGFHGVYWFAMVRLHPEAPGAITGAVAPGALLGGVAGPLLFGWVASTAGYATAWILMAGISVAAAGTIHLGRRRMGDPVG